ncbi:MAG: ATP-binding protein [Synergistaceae bacterium]|nr:ATP-binding protein [Synergistaceae bacterium]
MSDLLRLPLGIQTFPEMRRDGYVYVDKTKYLADMYKDGKWYFLSRPRRFGKSLTVSTFDALFSGRRELFAGLAAEEVFDLPNYRPHPVIHMDMSHVTANRDVLTAERSLTSVVMEEAENHDIEVDANMPPGDAFRRLITRLARRDGRIVVLVDEYDKPYLDLMRKSNDAGSRPSAEAIREAIRNFYIQIKASDKYLRFVFITGISKFARMGVFSAMNNMEDISMDKHYAAMLGYTQEELEHYFAPHIEAAAAEMGIEPRVLLDKMRAYYDGFSFDGKTMLYNPFSTVSFFKKRDFGNYWFESGTPSFIANYLKERCATAEQFRGLEVSKDFAATPGEIASASAASFLYQSGYLSLRLSGRDDSYLLDYPNLEVLQSMSKLMTINILGDIETETANMELQRAIEGRDPSAVIACFDLILAGIPYDDYVRANAKSIMTPDVKYDEWLCRSSLLSYLRGAGIRVEAEVHGARGRADMVATRGNWTWVIELKIAHKGEDAEKLADDAMRQIVEMGYARPYKTPALLSVVIDGTKHSVTAFRFMA